MTRQERRARRRELEDSLARADAMSPRRLDDWDRPVRVHLFTGARVDVHADVMADQA
jgi:hypothetical protein